jgi:hypothetical protein
MLPSAMPWTMAAWYSIRGGKATFAKLAFAKLAPGEVRSLVVSPKGLLAAVLACCALARAAWPQEAGPAAPGAPGASAAPWLWRAATGGQIRSRPAVGPDGTVYALSEDSYLYAWVAGGSLLWKHDLGWLPWDCLAVSKDGTIYAGLKSGDFAAVNPRGGRLWTVRLDGLPAGDPAVAADGTVLVGTAAGTLTAFSHLGQREWAVTLPGPVTGPPVIDGDGTIYVAAADRRLYCLSPWGEFSWSLPLPGAPAGSALASDGSVLIGSEGGEILAVNPGGDVRWKARLGAPVVGMVVGGRRVVASASDGRLAAFSLDGRELWRIPSVKPPGGPPLLSGTQLLLPAQDGSIQMLDYVRGTSNGLLAGAAGSMVLADDGSILVGGRDWVVYALDPRAAAATPPNAAAPAGAVEPGPAPWPQPGHDAMHSGRSPARPPSGSLSSLETNPDYLYLQALATAPGREGVQLVLSDIDRRISSRSLGKSRWYVGRMLERIVGLGLVTQVRQNQRLVNDFPDLRASAAALLGEVGSTGSRDALLRAVDSERDGVALAAEVQALGAIASDGDGASLRAIVRAFTSRARQSVDNRLASAMVDALGRIAVYEGGISEPSAISALLAVSTGGYDSSVRSAAVSILQGDLKAYILNREE